MTNDKNMDNLYDLNTSRCGKILIEYCYLSKSDIIDGLNFTTILNSFVDDDPDFDFSFEILSEIFEDDKNLPFNVDIYESLLKSKFLVHDDEMKIVRLNSAYAQMNKSFEGLKNAKK